MATLQTRETRLRAQHAGEVEALAAGHRQQLQRAHNDAAEWHVRVEEGAGLCEQLRAAVQRAGEGEAAAKQQMVASERRVEQMDTELRQLGTRDLPALSSGCARVCGQRGWMPEARRRYGLRWQRMG